MKNIFSSLLFGSLLLFAFNSTAAIQYNLQTGTGDAYFTVDSQSTVYVNVKQSTGESIALGDSVITNIGYFYYDDVSKYRQAHPTNTGFGPSRPNLWGPGGQPFDYPTLHYGDMKTGALGEFKPGDKIVLWVETTSADGQKSSFTMYGPDAQTNDIWMLNESGENIVFNWGDYGVDYGKKSQNVINPSDFQFSITTNAPSAPNGQPLPGIIATLLVGGGSLIYLKKRKKHSADK